MCLISLHGTLENGSDSIFCVMCTLLQYKGIFNKLPKDGLLQPQLCGGDRERTSAPELHPVSASGVGSARSSSEGSFGHDPPSSPSSHEPCQEAQVEASGPGQAMESKREAGKRNCTHKFEHGGLLLEQKVRQVFGSERRRQRQHQEAVAQPWQRVLIAWRYLPPSDQCRQMCNSKLALWQVRVRGGEPGFVVWANTCDVNTPTKANFKSCQ